MTNITRRTFLAYLGATAGLAMLAKVGCTSRKSQPVIGEPAPDQPWAFLDSTCSADSLAREHLSETKLDERCMKGDCSRVGPEHPDAGSYLLEAQQKFAKILAHLDPEGLELTVLLQRYFVPDTDKVIKSQRNYVNSAIDFLTESLPLSLPDLDIVVATPATALQKRTAPYSAPVPLILSNSVLDLATITLKQNGTEIGEYHRFTPDFASYHAFVIDDGQLRTEQIAVCSAEGTSLISLFSELIPFATHPRAVQAFRTREQAIVASETIEEALAYHLAISISDKLLIPQGKQKIEQLATQLLTSQNSSYQHVAASMRYVAKVGVKAAFAEFMEDPQKYLMSLQYH